MSEVNYDNLNDFQFSQLIFNLRKQGELDKAEQIAKARINETIKNKNILIKHTINAYAWVICSKYFKDGFDFQKYKELMELFEFINVEISSYSYIVNSLIRYLKSSKVNLKDQMYLLSLVNPALLNNDQNPQSKIEDNPVKYDSTLARYASYYGKLLFQNNKKDFINFFNKIQPLNPNFINPKNKYWYLSKYYNSIGLQGEVKSAKANLIWIRNELRNGIIDTYIGDIVLKINKEEALWYYVKSVKEDKNYKILYRSFLHIASISQDLGNVEEALLFYNYFKKLIDKYNYSFKDKFIIKELEGTSLQFSENEVHQKLDELYFKYMPRIQGQINNYIKSKGFGFIKNSEKNKEFYFNHYNLRYKEQVDKIREGEKVLFLPNIKLNKDRRKKEKFLFNAEHVELI